MGLLKSLSQWLVATLEPWGALGLMLIAIGDSSFLSLPEVNDIALMTLSINHPYRMWELAAATVLGSVIGCTLLYTVGRKGGEAMLHRRFASEKVARVRGWYKKYGMLAVIVPSLLPPPLPFKIFVLSAGAFELPWLRFILAVAIGRSIRYFSEGILAVWYGKQAMQIVADNFPIVGMILAGLIVAATVAYVVIRRRKAAAGLVLLPLLITFLGSGCVRTAVVPPEARMLKSYPFNREQAIQRLETISRSIQSLKTSIELTASTASLKQEFTRQTAPTLNGVLFIQDPNRILIKASHTGFSIFELVSDGTQFQFYSPQKAEIYVDGREDGPPYKRFSHLGDLTNQFINLRPRQIEQALVVDVLSLLSNPKISVAANENPVTQDRRKYFCVDFYENSESRAARLLQRYWFDLSTEKIDLVRRQTWNGKDELEVDAKYAEFESLQSGIRYPGKIEIEFAATDTLIQIALDPKDAVFNSALPANTFDFNPHPEAKIYRFEPAGSSSVTQQR
jgi:membrane protein YqaA with SNARE-associated domain/outer membrane lipoprotein-sorting protein